MERIVVLVTTQEKERIKQAAGLIPLSAYLKAAVLAQLNGRGVAKVKGEK